LVFYGFNIYFIQYGTYIIVLKKEFSIFLSVTLLMLALDVNSSLNGKEIDCMAGQRGEKAA